MKDAKQYIIRLIQFKELEQEIVALRNLSWKENPTGKPVIYDTAVDKVLDEKCIHLGIFNKDVLVAAARVLITSKLSETPHASHLSTSASESITGILGSITRVVVHPEHRFHGLAVKIMNASEVEARKVGVNTLLGYPADWSLKLMEKCEYEMVENLGDIIPELLGYPHYLMKKDLS